ncbi:hypothetical protein SAMN05421810_103451 [Amycolatopsis arida]|uniref:Uncharacterized protein n=1 Tax=Amycolatopsis arida TaxID=587909 RepID=A0A1I5T9L0_9PSEU|nr:hypothetical protein [Amycolatopsis arida]TDX96170.1 hypothetical protein CLV69_103306 [Amycolatopsis arida]SFP79725.1 hypothetical protein SAMN05421810_103451 [Amycolatopsis arida]
MDVNGVVAILVILAIFGFVLNGLVWVAAQVRRRGAGIGFLGPFDEIWHPAGYRARLDIEIQAEHRAPAPSPGDPPTDAERR